MAKLHYIVLYIQDREIPRCNLTENEWDALCTVAQKVISYYIVYTCTCIVMHYAWFTVSGLQDVL